MRDPTIPDSETRKKFMFYDSEERQIALRVRCQHDGFNQSQFFRMMITGYIEGNKLVHEFISDCKERYSIQGIQKKNKLNKFKEMGDDNIKKFGLDSDEIENIFDIIETDTGL